MTTKTVTKNAVSKKKGKNIKKTLPISTEALKRKGKKGRASTVAKKTKKNLPKETVKGNKTKATKKAKVNNTASTEAKKTKENLPVPEEVTANKNEEVNNEASIEETQPELEAKKETDGFKIGKKIKRKRNTLKGTKTGEKNKLTVIRTKTKRSSADDVEEGTGVRLAVLNQAIEGVRILEQQRHSKQENQKDILGDDGEDTVIYMQVAMVKVAKLLHRAKHLVRPVKMKVSLPNSLVNSNTDVLLITKDNEEMKDIRDDHTENLHYYQHKLRVCGASRHISEVITLRQLKVEFKEHEAKRSLSNRTDVVLCDETILRRIPMFLGKHFYGKRKFPIPVNLKSKNLMAEIESRLKTEILWLPMTGNSGLMKIGRLGQTNEKIVENVKTAINKMKKQFPGGWDNVQTLYLKTEKSKAVPFYAKISPVNNIHHIVPKPLSNRPTVRGEVTSSYGDIYTVYPDYNVEYTRRVSYKRNEAEELKLRREQEAMEKLVVEDMPNTKKIKSVSPKKKAKSEKVENDKSPEKKRKTPGSSSTEVESSKKNVPGGDTQVSKKKKKNEDSSEKEAPKKKKKLSKGKQKKVKKAGSDIESDDEDLEKMEREFLKSLDTDQADVDAKKAEQSDEDDWAEGSGDDINMSGFEDDDDL